MFPARSQVGQDVIRAVVVLGFMVIYFATGCLLSMWVLLEMLHIPISHRTVLVNHPAS